MVSKNTSEDFLSCGIVGINMTNKILSICVPAYNAEKTLDKCLQSLVNTPLYEMIEIIVVNDGSIDNTYLIAESYKKNYPNCFIIINKENGGHGSTINAARKVATGKYFKVVDSDDWVKKESYTLLLDVLSDNNADVILTSTDLVAQDGSAIGRIDPYFRKEISCDIELMVKNEMVQKQLRLTMAGITIRTSLIQNSDYKIDEKMFFVDVEYVLYYFLNVENIYIMNCSLYQYLLGSSTQSVNIQNKQKRRNQHLNVCKKMINFYKSVKNQYTKEIIKNNILYGIIIPEYRLIMSLQDTNVSKKELMEFDAYLKDCCSELYKEVIIFDKGWGTRIISIMRKTHFDGYSLIHSIFKKQLIKNA